MELTIRQGTAEDLPELLRLYRDYHQGLLDVGMNYDLNEETLPRVMENRLRSRLILTAVAENGAGELCGFVFCSILRLAPEYVCRGESSVGYLNDLYVAPAARHQGLAQKLTQYAENWLKEQDISVMELQVLGKNANAREFWKKQGMEPIGTLCCKYL